MKIENLKNYNYQIYNAVTLSNLQCSNLFPQIPSPLNRGSTVILFLLVFVNFFQYQLLAGEK